MYSDSITVYFADPGPSTASIKYQLAKCARRPLSRCRAGAEKLCAFAPPPPLSRPVCVRQTRARTRSGPSRAGAGVIIFYWGVEVPRSIVVTIL